MSFTKRLCEGYKKIKNFSQTRNFFKQWNQDQKLDISMVWRSLHHKEILLSEPGRNTNIGENAFITELPLSRPLIIQTIEKLSMGVDQGNYEQEQLSYNLQNISYIHIRVIKRYLKR